MQNRNLAVASPGRRAAGTGAVVTWTLQAGGFVNAHSFGVVAGAWQVARIGKFDLGQSRPASLRDEVPCHAAMDCFADDRMHQIASVISVLTFVVSLH